MKEEFLAQTGFWRHVFSTAWQEAREEVRSHLVTSLLTVVASLALGTSIGVAGGGVVAAIISIVGLPLLIAILLYLWKLLPALGGIYHQQQGEMEALRQKLDALAKVLPTLEVIVHRHSELDSVFLLSAFSSNDPAKPHDVLVSFASAEPSPAPTRASDLTILVAYLNDIEVINHDDKPTELLRLWIGIKDPDSQNEVAPREVKKEELVGTRRIEARSRHRYRLHFKAVFRETISQQDGPQRVMLYAKTIGLGEQQIKLEEAFFPCSE